MSRLVDIPTHKAMTSQDIFLGLLTVIATDIHPKCLTDHSTKYIGMWFRLPTTLLTNNVHVSTNLLFLSFFTAIFGPTSVLFGTRVRIPLYILDWESELESDIKVMLS